MSVTETRRAAGYPPREHYVELTSRMLLLPNAELVNAPAMLVLRRSGEAADGGTADGAGTLTASLKPLRGHRREQEALEVPAGGPELVKALLARLRPGAAAAGERTRAHGTPGHRGHRAES